METMHAQCVTARVIIGGFKLSVLSCSTYPHVGKLSNLPMRGENQLTLFSIEMLYKDSDNCFRPKKEV